MTIDIQIIRRKDMQKEEVWIREIVMKGRHGVLGVSADEQPYLNANNYIYLPEDHAIYFHRSKEGVLPKFIAKNNKASYLIATMGKVIANTKALKFDVEYQSVMIYGDLEEIHDDVKKYVVLRKLLEKYAPELEYGKDYDAPSEQAIAKTAIWCLKIDFWTGKQSAENSA